MSTQYQALFLSHGGGPMPLLGDPGHREMVSCLERIAASMTRPEALLVVSAHWEADRPSLTAAATPSLIYDYYGFPEASYAIEYPCPGAPWLAQRAHTLLCDEEMDATLDYQRGFDHGLFVPLKIMYPQADIPCVQLSLLRTLDPTLHLAMGRALRSLAEANVLIVGSGFSFHNMKAFFAPSTAESECSNQDFEAWLAETCGNTGLGEAERAERLGHWSEAPGARFCHPREEHLLPLHVCYGAAERPCTVHHQLEILGKRSSMILW